MKKIFIMIMAMTLICSLIGCASHSVSKGDALTSGSETEVITDDISNKYDELLKEHNDLQTKYDDLLGKYSNVVDLYGELSEKYEAEIMDNLSTPVVITAIAKSIDDNAVITIYNEKIAHVMVSYSAGIKEKVEEFYWMIPSALSTEGYESLIISAIDETGKCVCGWTIYETGENDPFVS